MKKFLILITFLLIPFLSVNTASAASFADVVFVVDQSGSMGGEFTWIDNSISALNTALLAGGVTANYGIAGYERSAGTEYSGNIYSDLSSDINNVLNTLPPSLYGGIERGYHAADWATTGFSWTGGDYAKVIVLITDENADQGSGITELALGSKMDTGDFLLNVITYRSLFSQWDDAVYSTSSYLGLFDLDYLKNDAAGFTAAFTAAKLQEIQEHNNPVPEPATLLLFGLGLLGLAGVNRKRN